MQLFSTLLALASARPEAGYSYNAPSGGGGGGHGGGGGGFGGGIGGGGGKFFRSHVINLICYIIFFRKQESAEE